MEFTAGDLVHHLHLNVTVQIHEILKNGQIVYRFTDKDEYGMGAVKDFEMVVNFNQPVPMEIEDDENVLILSEDGQEAEEATVYKHLKKRTISDKQEEIVVINKKTKTTETVPLTKVVPSISGTVFNKDIFKMLIFGYQITVKNLYLMALTGRLWNDRINNRDDIWFMMLDRDYPIVLKNWLKYTDRELHDRMKNAIDTYTEDQTKRGRRYFKRLYELLVKMQQPNIFGSTLREKINATTSLKHLVHVWQCGDKTVGLFSSHATPFGSMSAHSPFLLIVKSSIPFYQAIESNKKKNALGISGLSEWNFELLAHDCDGFFYKLNHSGGHAGNPLQAGFYYIDSEGRKHQCFFENFPQHHFGSVRFHMNKRYIVQTFDGSRDYNSEGILNIKTIVYDRQTRNFIKEIADVYVTGISTIDTFDIVDFRFRQEENRQIVADYTTTREEIFDITNVAIKRYVDINQSFDNVPVERMLRIPAKLRTEKNFNNFTNRMYFSCDTKLFNPSNNSSESFGVRSKPRFDKPQLLLVPSNSTLNKAGTTRKKNSILKHEALVNMIIEGSSNIIRVYPGTVSAGLLVFYSISRGTTNLVSSQLCQLPLCENVAKNVCGKCKNAFYCSQECARIDWFSHTNECI